MDILKIKIIPILNAKQGNEILAELQKNKEYQDLNVVSVSPDPEYGYFMAVSYKVKE